MYRKTRRPVKLKEPRHLSAAAWARIARQSQNVRQFGAYPSLFAQLADKQPAKLKRRPLYPTSSDRISPSSNASAVRKATSRRSTDNLFTDFDIYGAKGLSKKAQAALMANYREMQRALRQYDKHITKVLDDPRLSDKSRRFLSDVWRGDRFDVPLSLANGHVRAALTKATMMVLLRHADNDRSARKGGTKLRMLTSCPDLAISPIADSKIQVAALNRQSNNVTRRSGVHGITFVDVAVVHDEGQPPAWISLHTHGAIRSPDAQFKPVKTARRVSPTKKPRNRFGGKVVSITATRKARSGIVRKGFSRIAYLAFYITKISCGTKVSYQAKAGPRYKTTLEHWGPNEALRMLEVYSHIEALDSLRAVGDGKALRTQIKVAFAKNLGIDKLPRGTRIDHDRLAKRWRRLYHELGLDGWQPIMPG